MSGVQKDLWGLGWVLILHWCLGRCVPRSSSCWAEVLDSLVHQPVLHCLVTFLYCRTIPTRCHSLGGDGAVKKAVF